MKDFADFMAHFFLPTFLMLAGAFGLGCCVGARHTARAVKQRLRTPHSNEEVLG